MFSRMVFASALVGMAALGLALAPAQDKKAKPAEDAPNGKFDIDPVHSAAMFKISHMNVGRFYGRFNKVGGKVVIDAEKPEESIISLTIDVDSVDTNNPDRDKHLKSPDFFNAAEHPKMSFESEKVKAKDADHFEVTGTLTLHGVEKEITVPVERTGFGAFPAQFGGTRVGYETKFKIKRTDYGMDYRTDMVGDEVEIVISVEAAR